MKTYILGIESSCDETSAAVVSNGIELLSNVVASQMNTHKKYGGVVPEVASRMHLESILPVVDSAVDEAGLGLEDISGIAITQGPGLIGSLLVGMASAKTISFALQKPLIGINHLEAHISAIHLENKIDFPFVALIASGGHTNLFLVNSYTDFEQISRTRDDAAGEAFDKAAKLMGLGYPGGVVIDKLASLGDSGIYKFPIPLNKKDSLDFSFSGIKTSLSIFLKKNGIKNDEDLHNICAGYQESIVRSLINKSVNAALEYKIDKIVFCGGVACNSRLRQLAGETGSEMGIEILYPSPSLCTDNAAMIASIGYFKFMNDETSDLYISSYSTSKPRIVRGQANF
ncbi:MAG: tRNA (adenosine(37)-N6)-threonylcarbamoyltransferase complex transferase subunit TsaD [Thermodesulfobacteriota bacterium]